MDQNETNALRALWRAEEQAAFSGWDFSRLDGRWRAGPLPWDYRTLVLEYLRPEHRLLGLGTGGGEVLLSLCHPYENTAVTEGWEPNVRLCLERLAPLGVDVRPAAGDDRLPFEANAFDIVLSRHESYDLSEVSRILKPGGFFITQQVGGENNLPLSKALYPGYVPPFSGFCLAGELPGFAAHGFETVFSAEAFPELLFFNTGAVVYFARVIEWDYPDFSVDGRFRELCALEETRREKGFIKSREHRFVIAARKTGQRP